MGYELDRLMQQYGVSTPVLAPAPVAPVRPVSPTELPTSMKPGDTNNPLWEQILKRNLDAHVARFGVDWNTNRTTDAERAAALAAMQSEYAQAARAAQDAFPGQQAAYDANRAAYDQYATEYQRRLRETPMYAQSQFAGPSTSTGFEHATAPGGIGKDKYYSNIREWIAAHPNASYADILEEANKWGVDNRDLMAATGSYWGNRLNMPAPVSPGSPYPPGEVRIPEMMDQWGRKESDPDFGKPPQGAVPGMPNMNESADGGGMDAGTGGSSIGQGVSNTAASIGLGLMGVPAIGLTGIAANAIGSAIAGQQADAMGEAAANLGAIEAMGLPGVVAVSDPSGNTFSFSSPATIAASDEADFGLDGVTAGDSPGDSGDGSSGVGGAGVGAAGGTGTGSAGEGPGWAKGGLAKLGQKYALGGRTRMGYDSPESEQYWQSYWATQGTPAEPFAVTDYAPAPAMPAARSMAPAMPMSVEAPDSAALKAPAPMPTPPATVTPVSPAAADLMSMLNRYQGAEGRPAYADELGRARRRYESETEAFNSMLAKALQPDGEKPDKSEMYFRLAAAFGAPTKTGNFTESLGAVGRELGELKKEERMTKRAERQARLQLGLEAQKMRMQAARDEMTTTRALASEEARDRRTVLAEYLRSGRPQSEAGKAAIDAGLQQGTPGFTSFVNKYLDEKISSGNAIREAMAAVAAGQLQVAQQGLSLRQQAEQRAATKAQSEAGQLSPTELKMKLDAEQSLGGLDDSMSALRRAYSLNPQTVEGTLAGTAQLKLLEQLDPEDPRVLATREQRNLLSKGAIEKLRSSFGGNPTEGERAALLDLEGLDSKSREERARIMRNTYDLLKARLKREQARLEDIKAGKYRQKTPTLAAEEID